MRLYISYLKVLLKSQMEYRTSFFLLSIGQFSLSFLVFISIYLLFERFNSIGDWSLYEVGLCYAVIHIGVSISECFARGFDVFSGLIVRGEFDRLLIRPRTTFLQVIGTKFEFTRIGRFMQGVIVFIFALSHLSIEWNMMKVITLVLMILSSVAIFTGLFILSATFSFFTIEGLEIMHILTDGGREISQYPLNIFKSWVRNFFTYVIPFATANYIPLMYILDKGDLNRPNLFYMTIPLYGFLFLVPCILIWNFGVKHYKSTGS